MAQCESCGALLEPGDAFCAACGSPAVPAHPACPSCGTDLEPDDRFCPLCGARVGAVAVEAARPAVSGGPAPAQPTQPAVSGGPPTALPTIPQPAGRGSATRIVAVVAVAVAIVVAAAAAFTVFAWHHGSSPGSGSNSNSGTTSNSGVGVSAGAAQPSAPTPVASATTSDSDQSPQDITSYASATASSHLPAQLGNTYVASNMLDGRLDTCWAEDVAGYGEGTVMTFTFTRPVVLTAIKVVPGYDKHVQGRYDRWSNNGRLREVRLDFSNGTHQVHHFRRRGWQTIALDQVETSAVDMTIVRTYPAIRGPHASQDTSVSEVGFTGWPSSP